MSKSILGSVFFTFPLLTSVSARLGGDAIQPHDPEWLKQQNAELQRQLKEAHARLDAMHGRPELRRTKLTGEAADKPLFGVEEASPVYVFFLGPSFWPW